MNLQVTEDVRVILPEALLTLIFDECDHYDQEETGGRIVGTYAEGSSNLTLYLSGMIDAGPQAKRTACSFFQDGEHQERVFREIESSHPEIEHLGNWHSHHVNGLSTLSSGDIETYQRTVKHKKHNCPFFYALLVVGRCKTKLPQHRYLVKHYILRRNDEPVFEISPRMVEIVSQPLVWPLVSAEPGASRCEVHDNLGARLERVIDNNVVSTCYPKMRPVTSPRLGLFWSGTLQLIDDSVLRIAVLEDSHSRAPRYSIVLRQPPDLFKDIADQLAQQHFSTASAALIMAERYCSRALHERNHSKEMAP